MFYNPANPRLKYETTSYSDPNIPAGYVDSQGSDGAQPMPLQVYVAGVNSGGFPAYVGDQTQETASPTNPNGILH